MATISTEHPVATAAVHAIRSGDVDALARLLHEHAWLATARLGDDDPDGMSRTLLHVATDWPGHFPNVAATIGALVEAGADVDARFRGPHEETPLHWAASSDDVEALDALLDAGADIEAPGAVLGGGPALADARGFKQWRAAFRLVERGARATLVDAATMGMFELVVESFSGVAPRPDPEEITRAFWGACHGGRQRCARYLLDRGAELNWVPPWEDLTPLDAADREGAGQLARWLRDRGGTRAVELSRSPVTGSGDAVETSE
jgi:ankyrin repeat protein